MSFTQEDVTWLLQRNGAEPGLWLMTVGADGAEPLRMALHDTAITSRGLVFGRGYFEFEEPEDGEDEPQSRIVVPNVDRVAGLALLEHFGRVTCQFEWVKESDPDRVLKAHRGLELLDAEITPLTVSGTLAVAQYDAEPYGAIKVVPAFFPGLFR